MRPAFVLLVCLGVWVIRGQAQTPNCIELNRRGVAQSELRSMQPINRFALIGDSIHEPLDLASANANDIPLNLAFVRPSNWNPSTTRNSYFWVYARRGNASPIPDHTLVLVQEQLFKGQFIRVYWVDPDGNLDFTSAVSDTLWDLQLPWELRVSPDLALLLEPFPVGRFPTFAQMHDASVHSLCGPRIYMGASSAFRYQRLNLRWGVYDYDSSKQVYVAVMDQNFNGYFGDVGVDKVMLSIDSSYFNDENSTTWEARSNTVQMVWRGRPWEMSLSGNDLCILEREGGDHPLIKGNRMPRIRYQLVSGGLYSPQKLGLHRSWRRYRKQPLLLYVWQADMGLPSSDSAVLSLFSQRQQKAWSDLMRNYKQENQGEEPPVRVLRSWLKDTGSILNMRLIMMAQGGNSRYISTLNRRFGFALDQVVLDNKAAKKMQCQSLPQILNVDACGRIVDADANLQILLGL